VLNFDFAHEQHTLLPVDVGVVELDRSLIRIPVAASSPISVS
jgi:hypothetical protein